MRLGVVGLRPRRSTVAEQAGVATARSQRWSRVGNQVANEKPGTASPLRRNGGQSKSIQPPAEERATAARSCDPCARDTEPCVRARHTSRRRRRLCARGQRRWCHVVSERPRTRFRPPQLDGLPRLHLRPADATGRPGHSLALRQRGRACLVSRWSATRLRAQRRELNSGRAPTTAGDGIEPQTKESVPPRSPLDRGCRCAHMPYSRVPGWRSTRIAASPT